jgi:hypothetical protein
MKADLAAKMDNAMLTGVSQKAGVTGVTHVAGVSATCSKPLKLQWLRPLLAENNELPNSIAEGVTDHVTGTVDQTKGNEIEEAAADAAIDERLEERAAHLEYDAGMPRSWAEPFARLLCSNSPAGCTAERWQCTVDAALTFADKWAAEAYKLGWTAEDVFGLHPLRHPPPGMTARRLPGFWTVAASRRSTPTVPTS